MTAFLSCFPNFQEQKKKIEKVASGKTIARRYHLREWLRKPILSNSHNFHKPYNFPIILIAPSFSISSSCHVSISLLDYYFFLYFYPSPILLSSRKRGQYSFRRKTDLYQLLWVGFPLLLIAKIVQFSPRTIASNLETAGPHWPAEYHLYSLLILQ